MRPAPSRRLASETLRLLGHLSRRPTRGCAGDVAVSASASVRHCAEIAVQAEPDRFKAWNVLVRRTVPERPPAEPLETLPTLQLSPGETLEAKLEFAPVNEVLNDMVAVALGPTGVDGDADDAVAAVVRRQERWEVVEERLKELEFDGPQSLLILHCMIQMGSFDRVLMMKLVERLEARYFSMEIGVGDLHPAIEALRAPGVRNFRMLLAGLPMSHKVALVLQDSCLYRDRGVYKERKPRPEADGKDAWNTMDPVDMEQWERDQYWKGRIGVKDVKKLKVKESRRVGPRLRAALATELLQEIPAADAAALAEMSQVCAFPNMRLLTGDLQEDFREQLSARVTGLDTEKEALPHLVALSAALKHFAGPEACRAWGRKLLPAVMKLEKSSDAAVLEAQGAVHPYLRGVRWPPPEVTDAGPNELYKLQLRAHRSAQLLYFVATARQVDIDCDLFDALAAPLRAAITEYLALSKEAAAPQLLLPMESLADAFDAQASSRIRDGEFSLLLGQLLLRQFQGVVSAAAEDSGEESATLPDLSPADCAAVAHGLSLARASSQEPEVIEKGMHLLWQVMEPRLKRTQPHLVLMLLNAFVRGGSERLLETPGLLQAVDELLVQKVDFDPEMLGRVGL
eukprot:TRINITY_DN15259_c0_g1_i1.p1 TRINITY_DN15259_c0_g1~~TRINITY_DN15259_c0_g1_i1.p1  ORF type:complete len:627 (+),score=151.17 TRINITY_DN15259_c0_g1_i1:121-2001(+)